MSALERIFSTKRSEVAAAIAKVPLAEVRSMARDANPVRGFKARLEAAKTPVALIAEVKKASPSKGLIRADFNPVEIAKAYERAGAHALSVLTDESYFQGSPENLRKARAATNLPALRKDFLYDPYQVYEARAWGADAILLIVASLSKSQIEEMAGVSRDLGMDTLVEVHTEDEAQTALQCRCDMIGVNNRDLSTFKTSLSTSETILPLLKGRVLAVSESAIETKQDVDRVQASGARAVLIGTTFCAAENIEGKVREVMGWQE